MRENRRTRSARPQGMSFASLLREAKGGASASACRPLLRSFRFPLKALLVGLLLATQTLFLAPQGVLCAQEDLRLRFSSETDSRSPALSLGEFRISLDSQLLTPERRFSLIADEFQVPPFRVPDRKLVLRGQQPFELPSNGRKGAASQRPSERLLTEFSPTLTWTATYLQSAPPRRNSTIGSARRLGRWAIYGEFAREAVPRNPPTPNDKTTVPFPSRVSANKSVFSGSSQTPVTRPLDPPMAGDGATSISLDRYYLEAIYNFLPSFQGKVSYNRAVAETRDQKEKIQVEGIVEAGKNVVIKAGFRNESVPELKNNRNANDTKVWTEFILKF